jgi:hypothetical protein
MNQGFDFWRESNESRKSMESNRSIPSILSICVITALRK